MLETAEATTLQRRRQLRGCRPRRATTISRRRQRRQLRWLVNDSLALATVIPADRSLELILELHSVRSPSSDAPSSPTRPNRRPRRIALTPGQTRGARAARSHAASALERGGRVAFRWQDEHSPHAAARPPSPLTRERRSAPSAAGALLHASARAHARSRRSTRGARRRSPRAFDVR